jgi:hypothetical protein
VVLDFPDDENGEVLRRMQRSGDDLTRPREVDFTVVLPNEVAARELASKFVELGHIASIKRTGVVANLPWDVVVRKVMIPTHQAITNFEQELQMAAARLGGRNDGWGCFESKAWDA